MGDTRGSWGGITNIWQTFQQLQQSVAQIVKLLTAGVLIQPTPSLIFTFASLPATAADWTSAICSNGRKPGEGPGAGTGVPVFFNPSTGTWFSYCSGAVVTT